MTYVCMLHNYVIMKENITSDYHMYHISGGGTKGVTPGTGAPPCLSSLSCLSCLSILSFYLLYPVYLVYSVYPVHLAYPVNPVYLVYPV